MTQEHRPATVRILMTATDEQGKPLAGVAREISVEEIRQARFPLLVEMAAEAATELDEVITRLYDISR